MEGRGQSYYRWYLLDYWTDGGVGRNRTGGPQSDRSTEMIISYALIYQNRDKISTTFSSHLNACCPTRRLESANETICDGDYKTLGPKLIFQQTSAWNDFGLAMISCVVLVLVIHDDDPLIGSRTISRGNGNSFKADASCSKRCYRNLLELCWRSFRWSPRRKFPMFLWLIQRLEDIHTIQFETHQRGDTSDFWLHW